MFLGKQIYGAYNQPLPEPAHCMPHKAVSKSFLCSAYTLTELAESFVPILEQMKQWSETHLC